MEDKKYKLSGEMSLSVPLDDADKLISLSDGTSTLLYIYVLRARGVVSPKKAAADLRRTEAEITKAFSVLSGAGLLLPEETAAALPLPAQELPEYTSSDLVLRSTESGEFKAIVDETQRILGRLLTGTDLKILFGIYDYLGLPPEVIFLLINHCVEDAHQRLGPGRLPSLHAIEREAYVWFNREILTLERAEEFLLKKRQQCEKQSEIKRILQINGRNFSASECKFVESWLDMGFSTDAIALAYDKTVIKTGGMQWKYMNSILESWHAKNLHTAEEAEAGDSRGSSRNPRFAAQGASPTAARDDSELLKKILGNGSKG
ncbi:MAG: DnaD domain protein [Oscillospiraceae bacterium]